MNSKFVILLEKFLSKQANAEEISRLKELLGQTETEDALSFYYEQKWKQASSVLDSKTDEQMWNYLKRHIAHDKHVVAKHPLWKKLLRVAVAVLIPITFAWMGYHFSENEKSGNKSITTSSSVPVSIGTGAGHKTELRLPDGTLVWLNSASSLQYDDSYNQKERIVCLQGEAYFEVGKDTTRPFIVRAGSLSVEAVGTGFNVKAYPDDNYIVTTLMEGGLRVSDSCRSELLSPNERLTFRKIERSFTKDVLLDAEQGVSWRDNQLVFLQESMEDIAKTLERMYGVQIHFASDNLKNIRFSGKIKNTNLDRVLQMIAFASPIDYVLDGDSAIIIQSKDPTIH
ncbi:MAG: DUF4974 domain-containing protein [Prevotellaceae bacterium]|jgi:ferric-dicitrate binding protein FerR (iron transport regulator)|nr:DUF4974 domain-containing protein [Prevotellaceae bacterium]